MPSFTFVSTANASSSAAATPVFVDIRPDTLNIDERLIEAAITPRTKAILPVHYAGVGCEMDAILEHRRSVTTCWSSRTRRRGSRRAYKGRPLGSIGAPRRLQLPRDQERHLRRRWSVARQRRAVHRPRGDRLEKGTNRRRFSEGRGRQVHVGRTSDPRTPERARRRLSLGAARDRARSEGRPPGSGTYVPRRPRRALEPPELFGGRSSRTTCAHNAHMYYLLVDRISSTGDQPHRIPGRARRQRGLPLRSASQLRPAGLRYARGRQVELENDDTDRRQRLLRLPLCGRPRWLERVSLHRGCRSRFLRGAARLADGPHRLAQRTWPASTQHPEVDSGIRTAAQRPSPPAGSDDGSRTARHTARTGRG